jgi:dihydroorotase
MSEFLNFGFSTEELIKLYTEIPAKLIYGKADGFIKPGALADIAILNVIEKPMRFMDLNGDLLDGDRMIRCEMTFKSGEPVFRQVDFN